MVQIDQPTRDFIATARVALGIADQLDDNEPAKGHLCTMRSTTLFRSWIRANRLGDAFYATVPAAHAALHAGIDKAGSAAGCRHRRQRARAHRRRLAVDAGANAAQSGAHFSHRHALDGAVP